MTAQTMNQQYHLILADIAMAAAIKTHDPQYVFYTGSAGYVAGSIRDQWLADTSDQRLVMRVVAMANAGVGSLQAMEPERLAKLADQYGVPVGQDLAGMIAGHFDAKREAWLSYTR
ncbi:hypothetical protein [Magnetospirillum sulfuroxidans]|uniref:Uncharacterized protein n=1 Tax=Magnetospirillum sulfuroxidans TaxID=611300 RepID=A0ABS5II59_9PROT|nr:hypothetical protein [Magnetospirillum sulfuroxidans]MBR9973448.1 hypothetical protein [Magnetospirillum sulfuroxidans]